MTTNSHTRTAEYAKEARAVVATCENLAEVSNRKAVEAVKNADDVYFAAATLLKRDTAAVRAELAEGLPRMEPTLARAREARFPEESSNGTRHPRVLLQS